MFTISRRVLSVFIQTDLLVDIAGVGVFLVFDTFVCSFVNTFFSEFQCKTRLHLRAMELNGDNFLLTLLRTGIPKSL